MSKSLAFFFCAAVAAISAVALGRNANANLDTDVCIFSYNRPMQLYACLESMDELMQDAHQISIIYRADSDSFEQGYEHVKTAFPNAHFFRQSATPHEDFKPLVLDIVYGKYSTDASYIIFCVDDIIVKDHFSLKECTEALQRTGAYGFFLRLGLGVDYCFMTNVQQGVPPLKMVSDKVMSWQFSKGLGDWNYPNTVDMTVYAKADIKDSLTKHPYKHPNSFEGAWSGDADSSKIGLCFKETKIVNIPDNRVFVNEWENRALNAHTVQELLDLFLKGQKIDISTVYQIKNRSAHIEHNLTFIPR